MDLCALHIMRDVVLNSTFLCTWKCLWVEAPAASWELPQNPLWAGICCFWDLFAIPSLAGQVQCVLLRLHWLKIQLRKTPGSCGTALCPNSCIFLTHHRIFWAVWGGLHSCKSDYRGFFTHNFIPVLTPAAGEEVEGAGRRRWMIPIAENLKKFWWAIKMCHCCTPDVCI